MSLSCNKRLKLVDDVTTYHIQQFAVNSVTMILIMAEIQIIVKIVRSYIRS